MPDFQTLNTHTEGAVLFAEINSPPMNLLGTALGHRSCVADRASGQG